jgi:lipooligosaccharide transport system permease protein
MTGSIQLDGAAPAASVAEIARKPRRFGALYIAEHRIRGVRAWWKTFVITAVGNPLLYLVSLGVGLATLVPKGVGGVPYVVFVAPALLVTAAVTAAAEESTYPYLMGFKWNPIFLAMNAAPLTGAQIAQGMAIAIGFRVVITAVVYYAIAAAFGAVLLPLTGWLAVPAAVLAGMALSSLITAFTATVTEDKGQMAIIMRFIVMPLFLFSGTFFPLERLPLALQWIGWISPVWHGTQLGRDATYGLGEPAWLAVVHVVYLAVLATAGLLRTQQVITRRLDR